MELLLLSFLVCLNAPSTIATPWRLAERGLIEDGFPITKGPVDLYRRQEEDRVHVSLCGYKDGDLNTPRSAAKDWDCVVDTRDGYWGFCPQTIQAVSDCPIARVCVDLHDCSDGCGRTDIKTTFSCLDTSRGFCNSDLLTAGDQTYSYLACGEAYKTDTYSAAADFISVPGSSTASSGPETTTRAQTSRQQTSSAAANSRNTAPASSETSAPPLVDSSSDSSPNIGAIVGGVVGGLAVILIIAGLFFLRKTRKLAKQTKEFNELPTQGEEPEPYKYAQQARPVTELAAPAFMAPTAELAGEPVTTGEQGDMNKHTPRKE